jgi:hypothetical protein
VLLERCLVLYRYPGIVASGRKQSRHLSAFDESLLSPRSPFFRHRSLWFDCFKLLVRQRPHPTSNMSGRSWFFAGALMLWNFWNTVFDAAFGGSLISNSQRSSDYLMPMPILYKHGSNAFCFRSVLILVRLPWNRLLISPVERLSQHSRIV